MTNRVYPDKDYDTPVNVPGWTVQNSATGTDQNLTGNAGVNPLTFIAQLNTGTATTAQIATAVNTLLTELIGVGWMKAS